MTISERIDSDLKAALKNRDDLRLQVMRLLKSDIRYKQIELKRDLADEDVVGVLNTAAKKRREAEEEYRRGGRIDLAEKELAELEIIKEFLPEQLSPEELSSLIDKAVTETNAVSIKDLGLVMKVLMPEIRGRADGKAVNAAVRARLEAK
jgi:uncharacterized protein YqeY